MKIPQHKIDQIRHASDIVELISHYVTLKQRGRNFLGLCPFHNEKTPSFTVSPDKQMFYCFGCHTGGDAFTFIKLYEKINYGEAIRLLAERAHIDLEFTQEDARDQSEIESLYFVHKMAALFYYNQLISPRGEPARDYLKKRGFDDKTSKAFGIGYAPNAWDGLIDHAKTQSMDIQVLEKAGLIIPKSDGNGFYDRFRHRVIFPIFNVSGRVIAFGGRQLSEEKDSPKYLNSPESLIYHKGAVLYGLSQAKDSVRRQDEIVIVEGYADCVSLHQFGITNVTASSGTAFTMDQANLIRRYTQNVTLIYDGDSAGIRAAERGGALMLEAGLNVKIVVLPQNHDPDSYVREIGADDFQKTIQGGQDYVDFRMSIWARENKLDSVNARTQAARELLQIIARMGDPLKQNLFLKEVSAKIGLDEILLGQEMKKLSSKTRSDDTALEIPEARKVEKTPIPEHILRAERCILRSLLTDGPTQAEYVFTYLRPENFQNDSIRKVVDFIYTQFSMQETFSIESVNSSFDDDIQKAISRLLIDEMNLYELDDCLCQIQAREIDKKINMLRLVIKQTEEEHEEVGPLQDAWLFLNKQLRTVRDRKQLIKIEDMPSQERMDLQSHA